jgi:hypothetical protein
MRRRQTREFSIGDCAKIGVMPTTFEKKSKDGAAKEEISVS